jgi:glycosyltransferase involved in cell wall biosynthesis
MSRLALLVPAYNAERVIGRLFDSIDAQTSPIDDVLVYDDASTDGTGAIARTRGAQVVRGEVNVGPSRGKNVLAATTSAEWVHFHDADDALHPEFVARARAWMRQDDADVVLFGTEDRDDRTGSALARREWNDADLQQDPVRCAIRDTITNCGIYRRERFLAAGGFNLDRAVQYNEDQAMHLRLALAGLRFRAEALAGVIIHQRPGSMSSGNRVACARAEIAVMGLAAAATGRTYAAEIGAKFWKLAGVAAGYGDWPSVRLCLDGAAAVGYRDPVDEHWLMRALARVHPLGAIAVREASIRTLKPRLRRSMPRATPESPAREAAAR